MLSIISALVILNSDINSNYIIFTYVFCKKICETFESKNQSMKLVFILYNDFISETEKDFHQFIFVLSLPLCSYI